MNKKRFRYITSGGVEPTDPISYYRLLAKQKLSGHTSAIRIELPENSILEKWKCDEYSTWHDKNTQDPILKNLNPKICIKINGRWQILKDATQNWLNGKDLSDAKKNEIENKLYPIAIFNIGYVTDKQHIWYYSNETYAWRLDRIPADLNNIVIPPLTKDQIDTLIFIKDQFLKYYEELVDNDSMFIYDNEKPGFKIFLKKYIDNVSNDELAALWHSHSTRSLDPNKKFETKKFIDIMSKSKYRYVDKQHYKYAIRDLIEKLKYDYRMEIRFSKHSETKKINT